MFSFRIRLPFGTLKFKTFAAMRSAERNGSVPGVRVGRYYLLWWSKRQERQRRPRRPPSCQGECGGGLSGEQ